MAFSYKLVQLEIEELMQIAALAKSASYQTVVNLSQNKEDLTAVKIQELEKHAVDLNTKLSELKRKIRQIKSDELNQD